MRILLTGSNGFLGKHISSQMFSSHNVITLSKSNAQINCDLSVTQPELPSVDLVVHAAGKAHIVPKTKSEQNDFFSVNVEGTRNLLKGLENLDSLPRYFVYVSSVSVYGLETGLNIPETSPLTASDPYGKSKIICEKIIIDWCESHNVKFTILRLPLLIGSGSKGNLSSMISGIRNGYYFNVNGGKSKKSMVLASDVARFIDKASIVGGIFNLTDGYHPSFKEISTKISFYLGRKEPINIPYFLARIAAYIGDQFGNLSPVNSRLLKKINSSLTFDDSKARFEFGWAPNPVLENLNKIL